MVGGGLARRRPARDVAVASRQIWGLGIWGLGTGAAGASRHIWVTRRRVKRWSAAYEGRTWWACGGGCTRGTRGCGLQVWGAVSRGCGAAALAVSEVIVLRRGGRPRRGARRRGWGVTQGAGGSGPTGWGQGCGDIGSSRGMCPRAGAARVWARARRRGRQRQQQRRYGC